MVRGRMQVGCRTWRGKRLENLISAAAIALDIRAMHLATCTLILKIRHTLFSAGHDYDGAQRQ